MPAGPVPAGFFVPLGGVSEKLKHSQRFGRAAISLTRKEGAKTGA
jgi:hypothetical protein